MPGKERSKKSDSNQQFRVGAKRIEGEKEKKKKKKKKEGYALSCIVERKSQSRAE